MKTKFLILSGIFLILLLIFLTKKNVSNENVENLISPLGLSEMEIKSINRVRITGAIGSYDINRTDILKNNSPILTRSNWVLREPLFAPVNEENINNLIDLLAQIKGELIPLNDLERSKMGEYGLVPPSFVVMLGSGDKNIVLSFGHPNDVTERLFIQKEGDPFLYLISESVIPSIQKLLNSMRSYEVLKFDINKVSQIDVVNGEKNYRLKRDSCDLKKIWKVIDAGFDQTADTILVDKEIDELSKIRVNKIYDNPLDILQFTGLASPLLIMKIKFKMEETGEECKISQEQFKKSDEVFIQIGRGVDISKAKDSLVKTPLYFMKIAGESIIYELQGGVFGDWIQGSEHFRNKEPFSELKVNKSQKIEIVLPEKKCAAVKSLDEKIDFDSLKEKINEIKLDTVVSLEEFRDFEKVNGPKFSLSEKTGCSNGFEEIGHLKQVGEDGSKQTVASILKIFSCKEKDLFGVIENKKFLLVTDFLEKYCK